MPSISLRLWLAALVALYTSLGSARPRFDHCPNLEINYKEDFSFDLLDLFEPAGDSGIPPRIWEPYNHPEFPNHEVPPWLSISADERFTGNPNQSSFLKTYQFSLRVVDNESADECINSTIKVVAKPKWTNLPNTLDLIEAQEDQPFTFELKNHVFNPAAGIAGYELSYSKDSATPPWISLDPSSGKLTGTPRRVNVGDFEGFEFTVSNKDGVSITQAKISVKLTVHPPFWKQKPIQLPNGIEAGQYSQNLNPFIDNFEQMPLHCSKENPSNWPAWLTINSSCQLSGVPAFADVGPVNVQVRFDSDPFQGQVYSDITNLQFTVFEINDPPQFNAMKFFVKERETLQQNLVDPLSPFITDPEGSPLTCQLITPDSWISVSSSCLLKASPTHAALGMNQEKVHLFSLRVSDGENEVDGVLQVTVLRNPQPPQWLENPISLSIGTGVPLSGQTLAGKAKDLDDWPLSFKGGESFLSVSPTGELTGTPNDTHIGLNTFTVEACNDGLCTPATLLITVLQKIQIDKIKIGAPVSNAKTENIWLIDTSNASGLLVNTLGKKMELYYTPINEPEPPDYPVAHKGVFLSSDWLNHQADPIYSSQLLMKSTDFDNAQDWRDRKTLAWSHNCSNTPIWVLYQFYKKHGTLPEFFEENIPAEVLVVSDRSDVYRLYAAKDPLVDDWYIREFVDYFKKFNKKKKKSLTITAISAECSHRDEKKGVTRLGTYGLLTQLTGGKCYTWSLSKINQQIKDYAADVRTRAALFAKYEIILTKTPYLPDPEFKVTLAGKPLTGNTGSPDDLWTFQPPNRILLNWDLISLGNLDPNDEIVVEYRLF